MALADRPRHPDLLCEADREGRVITVYVGAELSKEEALALFADAFDVVIGEKYSAVPIERWARRRLL